MTGIRLALPARVLGQLILALALGGAAWAALRCLVGWHGARIAPENLAFDWRRDLAFSLTAVALVPLPVLWACWQASREALAVTGTSPGAAEAGHRARRPRGAAWRDLGRATWLQAVFCLAAFAALHGLLQSAALRPFGLAGPASAGRLETVRAFVARAFVDAPVVVAVGGFSFLLTSRVVARRTARRRLDLAREVARTRTRLLRARLDPHYLFNTLNTAGALLHDPPRARRVLERLRTLLAVAGAATDELVSLERELEIVDAYVVIERERFGAGLELEVSVDRGALRAAVPPLLLQPLVENAIHHGFGGQERGLIRLRARLAGSRLRLEVEDDGHGTPGRRAASPVERRKPRIGIATTRARLEQLFASQHLFEISYRPGAGTRVLIEVPFRAAPDQPPRSPIP